MAVNITEMAIPNRNLLHPLQAETAGGSGAAVDTSQFVELFVALYVQAISGTSATLNMFIDASDDGGTVWYQIATLGPANITAAPTYPVSGYNLTLGVAAGAAAFGPTLRCRWTLSGTSPSCTFRVTAIGK